MEARIRILSDPEFFLASFQFIIITVIAARLLTCFSSAGKNIDINFLLHCVNAHCRTSLLEYATTKCDKSLRILRITVLL